MTTAVKGNGRRAEETSSHLYMNVRWFERGSIKILHKAQGPEHALQEIIGDNSQEPLAENGLLTTTKNQVRFNMSAVAVSTWWRAEEGSSSCVLEDAAGAKAMMVWMG